MGVGGQCPGRFTHEKDPVAIVMRITMLLKDHRGMSKFQYKTNRNAMAVSCPIDC